MKKNCWYRETDFDTKGSFCIETNSAAKAVDIESNFGLGIDFSSKIVGTETDFDQNVNLVPETDFVPTMLI